jgi:uncharacterized RDD family membrane protein YckC
METTLSVPPPGAAAPVAGQTLGKRLLGLRVLMRDGRPATVSAVSARTVLRLIDNTLVGPIVVLLSGRSR